MVPHHRVGPVGAAGDDKLGQLVQDNWATLEKASTLEIVTAFRSIGQLKDFAKYNDAQVWEAVEKKRNGTGEDKPEPTDLKSPEWAVFSNPGTAQESKDFRLRPVDPPLGYEVYFERIVLAEKLREVRALVGFTRIESPRDFDSAEEFPKEKKAPLSRRQSTWVPACETRGEGIFFQFSEAAIQKWMTYTDRVNAEFKSAARAVAGQPQPRPVHRLPRHPVRAAAQLRPRPDPPTVHRVRVHHGVGRRAHLLPRRDGRRPDGGRPDLHRRPRLRGHARRAVRTGGVRRSSGVTSIKPWSGSACAPPIRSVPSTCRAWTTSLHGAACHACSFLPETSCERGNKYLDRSVLVPTVERPDLAFFK